MITFAKNIVSMTTTIIRIGNSKGIIIPSSILKKMALSEKDNVKITLNNNVVSIEKDDSYRGPYTGPFAALKGGESLWGGPDVDARDVAAELRSKRVNREIPQW